METLHNEMPTAEREYDLNKAAELNMETPRAEKS